MPAEQRKASERREPGAFAASRIQPTRAGKERRTGRREPFFEPPPTPGMDLRPDPGDRLAQTEDQRPAARARSPGRREPRGNAEPRESAPRREEGGASSTRKGGGGGGRGPRRSWLRRITYWGLVVALWGVIAGVGLVIWVGAHLPPIQSLEVPKRPPSIQILGLGGKALATRGEMGGAAVPVRELPPYVPQAFIAIEDRRFHEHWGIDPIGVVRAGVANVLRRGVSQGGSTLTQQLAKNLFLTQERTFARKLQEVALALWLEHRFTKTQILDLYLNRVYFGSGAYGVEAASQRYFGKSARQVTLPEAALLAGLVKSPSRLAPTRNPEGAARRAQVVLGAMADAGFVSSDTARTAATHPGSSVKSSGPGSVGYVADWVMDVLDDLVGRIEDDVVVETSIDPTLQASAERAVVEELAQKGEKFSVGQGALVAMTPDGAVRALVGGRNYGESQYNRAVAARRQPGSAFKPFVYLTALQRGLTPDTVREDRPIDVRGWKPENYAREYLGPVTLTRALSQSLNTVAVRLCLEVGPKTVAQTAKRLGIASKLEPNASIALGTSEVSMLELVGAYAAFANGGMAVSPHVVERVRGANGRVLYRRPAPNAARAVEPRHVGMMNTMMAETVASGTARKAEMSPWQVAGKTGTSQDFRDAWFIGYTGHLVTGVWLGNDDNSPTRKTTGGSLPVEVWSRFMRPAHAGVTPVELPGVGPRAPASPAPSGAGAVVASRQGGAAAEPPGGTSLTSEGMTLDRWLLNTFFGRQ